MIPNENTSLHDVYLALGSNIGDRENNLESAIRQINDRIGKTITVSSFYTTQPVGFESKNSFLNAACYVQSALSPLQILDETQAIEKELGRIKKSVNQSYSDRTIDIDILLYDNLTVEYPRLLIPHPHMHTRDFVLLPLAQIAPNIIHPVLNKTILELQKDMQI
ncbi:2-amino-4-hydroxy-6-hydroxymethyldihydropteridine diphosphokinase [Dysgonomonas sp. OttesenSCG-928-M03]|nr:2-amino-4-hydroxy-6-hydroxymethyldihydropteridine diphosphokinase [Dysgonomonas sp. OttesenSCG-928-M03]